MSPELHPAPIRRPRGASRIKSPRGLMLFLGGHVALGIAMRLVPAFATVHAFACIAFGLMIAATRRPRDVAFVVAYISGSEVLWRLTHAAVFHEAGKYAIAAVLVVALTRHRARRNRGVAMTYLLCLIPSAALTFAALGPDNARQAVSFNLAGPLALTLCTIYFSSLRITMEDVRKLFWTLMGPVIGISTIVFFSTAAVKELKFSHESNFATSAGFGPNQVSSILGLALMFAVLMLLERRQAWRLRAVLVVLAGVFAVQAALTFSRGGLFLALAGVLASVAYLLRSARARMTILVAGGLLIALGNFVVAPELEDFTHGKLAQRYTNLDSNGRTQLAAIDVEIFEEHPILGVGPGIAPQLRGELGHRGAAHTEFTRMLSEHGVLGIVAAAMLALLGFRTFRATRGLEARAMVAALLAWVTLFLAINAMRLVAPCFLFGLACAVSFSSIPPRAPKPKPA